MKVVILAGGLGTRISEETSVRPKPMVEIGGRPILWHIMKTYSQYGHNEFVVCLGYKGYMIKEFFANYHLHMSDVTIRLVDNSIEVHRNAAEPWSITLVDTGETTQTGGRLRHVLPYVKDEPYFALTYGDGLANVDINAEVEFHKRHGRLATVIGVRPPSRFGAMTVDDERVSVFAEKPKTGEGWINGGYFILSPRVGELLADEQTIWEHAPLEQLAREDQLRAFLHEGFWHPMDTLRDRHILEELWASGRAPWRVW